MIVPVYWGTHYTSTATQRLRKNVTCEKCGCPFAYELVRQAAGTGRSVYNLDNQGAHQRAQHQATSTIHAMLANDEDPVPCPRCGWFQKSMVQKNSRVQWDWTPWGAGANIDPNRDFPQHRGRFPGMPVAHDLSSDADPHPTFPLPDLEPDNTVTLRLLRDAVPDCCCQCLGPADARVKVGGKLYLPLCMRCHHKLLGARLLLIAATAGSVVLFLGLALFLLIWFTPSHDGKIHHSSEDLVGIVVLALVPAVALGFGTAVIAWLAYGYRFRAPVRLAGLDYARLSARLRFRNPDYLQKLREHIASTPLAPLAPD